MIGQQLLAACKVKQDLRLFGDAEPRQQGLCSLEQRGQPLGLIVADQQFRRRHPGELVKDHVACRRVVLEFAHEKFASGEIKKAESIVYTLGLFLAALFLTGQGGDVKIALVVQELGISDHPRRDHPYHLAFDNSLG